LQTLYPVFFNRRFSLKRKEAIIKTTDGDFLEADHYDKNPQRVAILSHGLEGNNRTRYMTGMAREFLAKNWSVLTWNFRACGRNMNRLLSMYHIGKTEDLEMVIRFAIEKLKYREIVLVGFSVGGNITLKYLGENGANIPKEIKAAAAISPPVDLGASADKLARPGNMLYMMNFLQSLKSKLERKEEQFPGKIDLRPLRSIKTFRQFDDAYTAPLNGFESAQDYYNKCSSVHYLKNITVPTLILTSANDPFLPEPCYPIKEAESNENLYLEMPATGGHVGFTNKGEGKSAWMFGRVVDFIGQFA
jgi:predicted alpha/beta-fold hydrolase